MHLRLSGYGRVGTTLGELSLHWRMDKTTTAVISSPQIDKDSWLLGYAFPTPIPQGTPPFRGSLKQWLQPSLSAYKPESGSEIQVWEGGETRIGASPRNTKIQLSQKVREIKCVISYIFTYISNSKVAEPTKNLIKLNILYWKIIKIN